MKKLTMMKYKAPQSKSLVNSLAYLSPLHPNTSSLVSISDLSPEKLIIAPTPGSY